MLWRKRNAISSVARNIRTARKRRGNAAPSILMRRFPGCVRENVQRETDILCLRTTAEVFSILTTCDHELRFCRGPGGLRFCSAPLGPPAPLAPPVVRSGCETHLQLCRRSQAAVLGFICSHRITTRRFSSLASGRDFLPAPVIFCLQKFNTLPTGNLTYLFYNLFRKKRKTN